MLRTTILIFGLFCAALLLGCSASQTNSNSTAANENKTGATKTTTTASAEKIGVPECDDFIAKYDACVSGKVPAAARAQYESMLKQWRDSWRQLAANPNTKATLATACKQAAEQARTSLKSYDCGF